VRTIAIVPVKALAEAKTRLAAVLTPPERAALTLRALRNVLAALDQPGIAERLVVSPDETVLREAQALGARGLQQVGGGLNEGLAQARARAIADGADAILVVLGDLPLLAQDDVAELLDLADRPGVAVFAPDRHGAGTNALLLYPAAALPFAFGAGSLARHRAAATARGLLICQYDAAGTALDLDTPDDLAALDEVVAASGVG
jgi:2-phospho-L-lactate guanylyltransferase